MIGKEFAAAVDKKEEQCDKTLSTSSADLMSVLCKMNSKLDV